MRFRSQPAQSEGSAKKSKRRGMMIGLGIVAVAILLFVLVAAFSSDKLASNEQSSPALATANSSKAVAPQVSQDTPKVNTPDLMDAKALDDTYVAAGILLCGDGVDAYLRSTAKYDFRWVGVGMFGDKFGGQYLKQVEKPGVLVLVTDKAEMQNGFGAYQRIAVLCSYDTQAKRVLSYAISGDD